MTCAQDFKSQEDLQTHQKDTYHFNELYGDEWTENEKLRAYLNAFYLEKALVMRDDHRKSRKCVQEVITAIQRKLTTFHNFCDAAILPAGSTATQTKVIQANEYDFNLVVICDQISVVEDPKKIYYDVRPPSVCMP